jgi:hypothetical protein
MENENKKSKYIEKQLKAIKDYGYKKVSIRENDGQLVKYFIKNIQDNIYFAIKFYGRINKTKLFFGSRVIIFENDEWQDTLSGYAFNGIQLNQDILKVIENNLIKRIKW